MSCSTPVPTNESQVRLVTRADTKYEIGRNAATPNKKDFGICTLPSAMRATIQAIDTTIIAIARRIIFACGIVTQEFGVKKNGSAPRNIIIPHRATESAVVWIFNIFVASNI
ncbi:MAG: hypothetical protein UY79_C0021G0004 [Parcubacteria group bacterium GW2011_GWA2_53_21]|nr:MAG: hypothetical protein UY79_C0021G0004 [Parcubacteria group bacterium GW2011_GWA2_53_21]